MSIVRSLARLLPALALVLLPAFPAAAKPVSGDDLARLLQACILADDGNPFSLGANNVDWGCCSKELGYCINCSGEPDAEKVCEQVPWRKLATPPSKAGAAAARRYLEDAVRALQK